VDALGSGRETSHAAMACLRTDRFGRRALLCRTVAGTYVQYTSTPNGDSSCASVRSADSHVETTRREFRVCFVMFGTHAPTVASTSSKCKSSPAVVPTACDRYFSSKRTLQWPTSRLHTPAISSRVRAGQERVSGRVERVGERDLDRRLCGGRWERRGVGGNRRRLVQQSIRGVALHGGPWCCRSNGHAIRLTRESSRCSRAGTSSQSRARMMTAAG